MQHWAADSRDPRRFDVTPPNDGTGSVRALYGAIPAALALTDAIPLADSYHYALRCFVLSLAWAKPSKRLNANLAASNMQEYRAALGGATQMQAAMAPSAGRDRAVQRTDRKSTRLNSSHIPLSRMPSSA